MDGALHLSSTEQLWGAFTTELPEDSRQAKPLTIFILYMWHAFRLLLHVWLVMWEAPGVMIKNTKGSLEFALVLLYNVPRLVNKTRATFQPMRSKTKTNRVLLARVFPRLATVTCICFLFRLVHWRCLRLLWLARVITFVLISRPHNRTFLYDVDHVDAGNVNHEKDVWFSQWHRHTGKTEIRVFTTDVESVSIIFQMCLCFKVL